MADAVLQQLATDAARDEGRDEDVRVEEQPHETRLNTSSRKSSSDWRSTSLREMRSSFATLSSARRTFCGRLMVTVSRMMY